MKKKIISGFFVLLIVGGIMAQLFPPTTIDGPLDIQMDISSDPNVPIEVATALKTGCYDCHSNEPNYPAYAEVGLVKYYLTNHIKGGHKELNFSIWNNYTPDQKKHKMEEICEQLENGNMPLWNYALLHKEAVLTENQKNKICQWVKGS